LAVAKGCGMDGDAVFFFIEEGDNCKKYDINY
jgi:hypothetical protein